MIELIYPSEPAPLVKGSAAAPAEEMLPVVEPSGNVVAQVSRAWCHGGSGLLHPVVHLHIINRSGEIYLQQRGAHKDLLPLRWDTAVGGHIDYGESVEEALRREAREELGIRDFTPSLIKRYVFESNVEKELVHSFRTVYEGPFTIDPEELDEGRFWSIEEIKASLGKGILTPNFEREFIQLKMDD